MVEMAAVYQTHFDKPSARESQAFPWLFPIIEVIHYALRFSDTGKPLTKSTRADYDLMAAHIVRHILRSNFILHRRSLEPGATPGRCGERLKHGT